MNNKNKNIRGLMLIEVVMATAIIAIAFVAFLSLFTVSTETSTYTGEKTDMMMAAKKLMEYYNEEAGFSALSLEADGVERDASSGLEPIYSAQYDAVRVCEFVPGTEEGLIKIVVKVKDKDDADYDSGVILVTQLSDIE